MPMAEGLWISSNLLTCGMRTLPSLLDNRQQCATILLRCVPPPWSAVDSSAAAAHSAADSSAALGVAVDLGLSS